MTRDDSIIRHLAEKVMGWHLVEKSGLRTVAYMPGGGMTTLYWDRGGDAPIRLWNPLESGNDMMMVWERAREMGLYVSLNSGSDTKNPKLFVSVVYDEPNDSISDAGPMECGPHAICEAVALATGFREG